jgi:hypothetical protein
MSERNVWGERQSGSKDLERGSFRQGNRRRLKIECLRRVGDPEFKRLKVAALNLFYPTVSPFCEKPFFHIALGGEG